MVAESYVELGNTLFPGFLSILNHLFQVKTEGDPEVKTSGRLGEGEPFNTGCIPESLAAETAVGLAEDRRIHKGRKMALKPVAHEPDPHIERHIEVKVSTGIYIVYAAVEDTAQRASGIIGFRINLVKTLQPAVKPSPAPPGMGLQGGIE